MKHVALAGLLTLGLLSTAEAGYIDISSGDHIRLFNGTGNGNGGEFNAVVQEWDGANYVASPQNWSSFCLEVDEYFHYGELLYVNDVSEMAMSGGSNTNSGDPISFATAWLYTQFTNGTLAGLNGAGDAVSGNYFDNHALNATHLQKAIWYLEDESLGVHNKYVDLAVDAGWTSIGDVRVLNLLRYSGGQLIKAQDQLVMLQPGLPPVIDAVPEPSTLALLGIGGVALAGYGWRRKRRRAAA